jgi:hypothetical protein
MVGAGIPVSVATDAIRYEPALGAGSEVFGFFIAMESLMRVVSPDLDSGSAEA